jgi:hypothetical protein
VSGDVSTMQSQASSDVRTNGTGNNPNWITDEENTALGNVARQLESDNDPGNAQQLWNVHVSQTVSNPSTQDSLMIDTSDTNRTPSAQLAAANEANGVTFSAPSSDLSSAVVDGGSDWLNEIGGEVSGGLNSITGSIATLGESLSDGVFSPIIKDDDDWAITSAAKDFTNGAISSVNNTASQASNVTSEISSSLKIGPSEGSAGGAQQNVRDSVSSQYQSMNLSGSQQQEFNDSFNQNLSSISGQSTSVDLNKSLDVGSASAVSATHISDAFEATKNDFAKGQK